MTASFTITNFSGAVRSLYLHSITNHQMRPPVLGEEEATVSLATLSLGSNLRCEWKGDTIYTWLD